MHKGMRLQATDGCPFRHKPDSRAGSDEWVEDYRKLLTFLSASSHLTHSAEKPALSETTGEPDSNTYSNQYTKKTTIAFHFNPEQKLFRQSLRKALEAVCPITEVRRVLESEAPYSTCAWETLNSLGVPAAAIPQEFGGLGLEYYELCIAAEEVGRALAPTPLSSSTYLATEALLLAGSKAQKQMWLTRLASGEAVAAYSDAAGTPDGARILPVMRDRITGVQSMVTDAAAASIVILLAQDSNGSSTPSLYLAPLVPGEFQYRSMRSIDPTRDVGELHFNGTVVEMLGTPGHGVALAQRVRDRAAILFAFEQIGGAGRALETARDYALDRRAFGRQIGSYQAIKHKLANIYIRNELARAHAMYGAWALSTGSPDLVLAGAAARVARRKRFALPRKKTFRPTVAWAGPHQSVHLARKPGFRLSGGALVSI